MTTQQPADAAARALPRARCSPARSRSARAAEAGRAHRAPAAKPFTVMLDFFPNADHAALYSAIANGDFRAVGLDVQPRDPGRTRPNR